MITKLHNSDLGRTIAAIAFTLVFSTTCLLGAVGPAAEGPLKAAAQTAHAFA